ncbi:MAG: BNR-4 repeat-containing protein [Bryobacterales bacterium]|nr:BNR-4 repeat-containing protein [Bryobacterales bacterium]
MRGLATLFLFAGWVLGQSTVVLNDDGGWCWFEDERSLVVKGRLIVGSIAGGTHDPQRRGDVEVTSHDLKTGRSERFTLHHSGDPRDQKRWFDDHNSPAFVVRGDGRLVAMYSLHGPDEKIYYRVSTRPGDATAWGAERVFVPSATSRVTYSNLHRLGRENRIYDFFRGFNNSYKPSYAFSDDEGETWKAGGVMLDVPLQVRHRPYVKYASDGRTTIHMAYTEGHPRDFDNSVYHSYYRDGKLHRSDGSVIRGLAEGLRAPQEGTRIFAGDKNNVAWVSDLHLDRRGHPYLAYSVQVNSGGKPLPEHGDDHRYRYARWNGSQWEDHEIAYAGSRLYPGEDDYTGNIALDPRDPFTVYVSTNADPVTGQPLRSAADGQRHWELYRGRTADGGRTWRWEALTHDSTQDQVRPMVPMGDSKQPIVLWLRGKMRAYTDYRFEVVARIE